MFTDNSSTPSSPLPGFGLAAMLSARSITTVRQGIRIAGAVQGVPLGVIVTAVQDRPGARWLLDDLSDVEQPEARRRAAHNAPAWMTRIHGVIESRDARVLHAAMARGDDVLDFECRADLHLAMTHMSMTYSTTSEDLPVRMAAGLLRYHVAQCLGRDAVSIPQPEPDVVARVLTSEGMALRPLETQVFPGFLDIGVADVDREAGPARRSMIFDRVTGSWHADD